MALLSAGYYLTHFSFIVFCCFYSFTFILALSSLHQMRQSMSTVAVKRRMKKETWVNRGQCLHKYKHKLFPKTTTQNHLALSLVHS